MVILSDLIKPRCLAESSIGITSPLMDHGGTGVVQLNFRVQLLVAWISYFSWRLYASTMVIRLVWSSTFVDISAISSAQTLAGHRMVPNWKPKELFCSWCSRGSTNRLYSVGPRMLPCFTPCCIGNLLESRPFHFTLGVLEAVFDE